jgi:hypothetical protein
VWHVIGRRSDDDDSAVDAAVAQVDGRPIDGAAIRDLLELAASRNASIPTVLETELERLDARGLSSGLLGIDGWGEEAAAAAEGQLRFQDRRLIWTPQSEVPSLPTVAWHDRSAVVVAIDPDFIELEFEYVPPHEDRDSYFSLRDLWPVDEPRRLGLPEYIDDFESVLDWRLYVGGNTLIIDGDMWLKRAGHRVGERLRGTLRMAGFPIKAGGALLIGKVHHVLGPLGGRSNQDDHWQGRLAKHEREFDNIAQRCPRLEPDCTRATSECVDVFIHGTRSTTLPALAALDSDGVLVRPTYRFEHDTHRKLHQNARELARMLRDYALSGADGRRELRLIAHSRGGLVARWARALLVQSDAALAQSISVVTLGTPHLGTPLVAEGLNVAAPLVGKYEEMRAILKMDTLTDARGVPIEDPLSLAFAFLLRRHALPDGIRAMEPESDQLEALGMITEGRDYRAIGGECDQSAVPKGFGVLLAKQILKEPHDLIVETSSSSHSPSENSRVVSCTHSAYFHNPDVHDELA